jgi:hypothetical protein
MGYSLAAVACWSGVLVATVYGCGSSTSGSGGNTCGKGTHAVNGQCVVIDAGADATAVKEAPDSAPVEASPGDDAGGQPVAVAMRWVYFTLGVSCAQPIACTDSAVCPASSSCTCVTCANPPTCIPSEITAHCCVQTGKIDASSVGQLVTDYPACKLTQTSPSTYALDCGLASGPSEYFTGGGGNTKVSGGQKYTDDPGCAWTPPYLVP